MKSFHTFRSGLTYDRDRKIFSHLLYSSAVNKIFYVNFPLRDTVANIGHHEGISRNKNDLFAEVTCLLVLIVVHRKTFIRVLDPLFCLLYRC